MDRFHSRSNTHRDRARASFWIWSCLRGLSGGRCDGARRRAPSTPASFFTRGRHPPTHSSTPVQRAAAAALLPQSRLFVLLVGAHTSACARVDSVCSTIRTSRSNKKFCRHACLRGGAAATGRGGGSRNGPVLRGARMQGLPPCRLHLLCCRAGAPRVPQSVFATGLLPASHQGRAQESTHRQAKPVPSSALRRPCRTRQSDAA